MCAPKMLVTKMFAAKMLTTKIKEMSIILSTPWFWILSLQNF